MFNVSLEQFYKRIYGKIALVGGYIEDKSVCGVIRSCRLKPLSAYTANFKCNASLEPIWLDEFGNALTIVKKKVKIKFDYCKPPDIGTDIFKNAEIKFMIEHSRNACIGLCDNGNFILLLWCSDNYFRCYSYMDGVMRIVSPLTVGWRLLRHCINIRIKDFKQLTIKPELRNLDGVKWFYTVLPVKQEHMTNFESYDKLKEILN